MDGIFAIVAAFRQADQGVRWLILLEGVLGIVIGVVAFIWPGTAALALLYLIAAWAVITGILEIAAAVGLRRVIRGEWALIVGGVASVIVGVLLAGWPKEGLLALAWDLRARVRGDATGSGLSSSKDAARLSRTKELGV